MCELASVDLKAIEKIVAWECEPLFPRIGRSAWYRLLEPVIVAYANKRLPIKSVKIKGVGLRNHRGEISKPSPTLYTRTIAHLGITATGEFFEAFGLPSPMGGIALDRATIEFYVSSLLTMNGCSSQIPLQLFQYNEPSLVSTINGAAPMPASVVVSGYPNDHYQRADSIINFPFETTETKRLIDTWASQLEVERMPNKWLGMMSRMWFLFGQNLRKFHETGFYRSNASPSNYGYCPEMDNIFLIDLDSARPLSECTALVKPIQLMRDVSSPCFHAMLSLLGREHISLHTDDDVFSHGIFNSILEGYFYDVDGKEFEGLLAIIKEQFKRVRRELSERYRELPNNTVSIDLPYPEYMVAIHSQRRSLMDRPETFALCIVALWDIYAKSGLHKLYPNHLSKADLHDKYTKFVAERRPTSLT